MFFGSSHCFKSVLAAHLASLLAWSALDSGDRVGGLAFNDQQHREVRPKRSRKTVLALLSELAAYNNDLPQPDAPHADSFANMLGQLRRIARPGSSIFLISDFRGASEEHSAKHLFQLAQHTEITAIACSDPVEARLPRAGRYAVTNGEQRSELYTADKAMRESYADNFQQRQQQLSNDLMRLGIPLLQASTLTSPFTLLQGYYGDRKR